MLKNLMFIWFALVTVTGCSSFLDEKQNQKLVVPGRIADLQALLDTYNVINMSDPGTVESADEYFLGNNEYAALNEYSRRVYTWEKDHLFPPGNSSDWAISYLNVYLANVVSEEIEGINRSSGDENEWNNAKGTAYFLRGKAFAQIAWLWALAYDPATESVDLGIPLRLTSNFNERSERPALRQTYEQIISDLNKAVQLLPVNSAHVMRPSKPAAYAWLSRVYLSMRKYEKANAYADSCLQLQNTLVDYNSVNPEMSPAFQSFNPEVIYHSEMRQIVYPPMAIVDTSLYALYEEDDLRKNIFFNKISDNRYGFVGSYAGSTYESGFFSGIATDEIYLTRAECRARLGDMDAALGDLNKLLSNRYKKNTFTPYRELTEEATIQLILTERRKELFWRGLRWMDIKRLNKEDANITLKRVIDGTNYELRPNDPRYALPIPEDVIEISGMQQNVR